MHANTDEDGFVKKMTYTPGNVHDSKEFDKLLGINKHKNKIKTYGEVYADSAYANKKNDEKLGNKITKFYTGLIEIHHLQTDKNKRINNDHPFAILLNALLVFVPIVQLLLLH